MDNFRYMNVPHLPVHVHGNLIKSGMWGEVVELSVGGKETLGGGTRRQSSNVPVKLEGKTLGEANLNNFRIQISELTSFRCRGELWTPWTCPHHRQFSSDPSEAPVRPFRCPGGNTLTQKTFFW